MTRITDRKIPCVYSCLSNKKKIGDLVRTVLSVMLIIENVFLGLFLTGNQGEAHMFYLAREVGKIWRCSC